MQAFTQLDIPSPEQWQFDAGEEEMLEGWESCLEERGGASPPAQPVVDIEAGALLLAAHRACVSAPPWTHVNADRYDEIVLRLSKSEAPTTLKLTYAAQADALPDARPLYVTIPAQSSQHTLLLSMAEHPSWSAQIRAIKIETLSDDTLAGATIGVDAIFFQSSQDQSTSAAIEGYVSLPFTPVSTTPPEPQMQGTGDDVNPGGMDPTPNQPDTSDPLTPDMQGTMEPSMEEPPPEAYHVKDGCNTTTPARPSSTTPLLLLLLATGAFSRARRARTQPRA